MAIAALQVTQMKARALSAYYRNASRIANERGGRVNQPGSVEALEHEGLWYVVLCNTNGILAVYRIREIKGEPVLKGLKRWPSAIDEVFGR